MSEICNYRAQWLCDIFSHSTPYGKICSKCDDSMLRCRYNLQHTQFFKCHHLRKRALQPARGNMTNANTFQPSQSLSVCSSMQVHKFIITLLLFLFLLLLLLLLLILCVIALTVFFLGMYDVENALNMFILSIGEKMWIDVQGKKGFHLMPSICCFYLSYVELKGAVCSFGKDNTTSSCFTFFIFGGSCHVSSFKQCSGDSLKWHSAHLIHDNLLMSH